MSDQPSVVVMAGPNGAGKSTTAPLVLRDEFGIVTYVNADVIATGLSAFAPEKAAMEAGRLMLSRLRELAAERASFSFETTLATRSYAPWLKELISTGYRFHLVYVWLASPELALDRVAGRVRSGGHHVPEVDVRRRYQRGLVNFAELYRPLANTWAVVDNTFPSGPILLATGGRERKLEVRAPIRWRLFEEALDASRDR